MDKAAFVDLECCFETPCSSVVVSLTKFIGRMKTSDNPTEQTVFFTIASPLSFDFLPIYFQLSLIDNGRTPSPLYMLRADRHENVTFPTSPSLTVQMKCMSPASLLPIVCHNEEAVIMEREVIKPDPTIPRSA